MAEYTRQDLERMQKEAENRVRNMQQRAQQNLNWEGFGHTPLPSSRNSQNMNHHYQPEHHTEPENYHEPEHHQEPEHYRDHDPPGQPEKLFSKSVSPFSQLLGGPLKFLENLNLKELLHDSDTALIAAILLLVCREDSDPLLTIALIYIML